MSMLRDPKVLMIIVLLAGVITLFQVNRILDRALEQALDKERVHAAEMKFMEERLRENNGSIEHCQEIARKICQPCGGSK